ncbi:MAG: serine hydroxymethyltransferase [Candidatus Moranbacteria bacterium]|nr:serine hydroxymethyltransferase [Candidatus Moranbacteria bacterium]MDD3964800.1 serine hydroxymethyltransferase [Candidatus Moranbacteria bacterium]
MKYTTIKKQDAKVYDALMGETKRQEEGFEMIASENYVSLSVLEAIGTVFTNKYSEGYPGRRYYGGQEFTDIVETLAIERAKKLFGAEHANVQPHAGAPANLAAYSAILKPGDVVLGMDLSHGGHLTHGHPLTLPAQIYRFVGYKTEADGTIDYRKLEALAKQEKPKLILAGFSSYTRQLDYEKITAIAKKVGAYSMMDMAHIAGLVAGKVVPSPVPYFDIVTTTTHKTLRGPRGGMILCKAELAKQIDRAVFPGLQGGPLMNTIMAKAVAFEEALQPAFKKYAKQILKNAKTLEKEMRKYDAVLLFGGTENHMIMLDTVKSYGISGKEAEKFLDIVGITVNKNVIPDDPRGPMDPSGIRVGVPAVTTRGLKEKEIKMIAKCIHFTLSSGGDTEVLSSIRTTVKKLCRQFPVYR